MKINDLVTITCLRDQRQFQIQCWSLGKFLEPCEFHIVINEPNTQSWMDWFEQNCQDYLKQHSIHIYQAQDIEHIHCNSGWITQQQLKLLFGLKLSKKYVLIDSKNWFVKPTKISDLTPIERFCSIDNVPDYYNKFIRYCEQQFGVKNFRPTHTPYVIDPNVIQQLIEYYGSPKNFCKFFYQYYDPSGPQYPSEFILYDMFAQYKKLDPTSLPESEYHASLWDCEHESVIDFLQRTSADSNIKTIGIHHSIWTNTDQHKIEKYIGFS